MSLHLVVGAGPVGSATARLLADAGERVRVVTRRGAGPEHPGVERVAADAADARRLTALAEGAVAVYNCANPPYHRWSTEWPPLHAAMVSAARSAGAVLAITGNLYAYGEVDRPMTEETPLAATSVKGRVRAEMWRQALAAGVPVFEARASDFVGRGATSMFSMVVEPAVRAGRTARLPGDPDAPHTVTYVGDVARTLVALARDERAWGRAWHVPSEEARSMRQLAALYAEVHRLPAPRIAGLPYPLVWAAGLTSPDLREFREISYQFRRPFVMDSGHTQATFGLKPTPLAEALA